MHGPMYIKISKTFNLTKKPAMNMKCRFHPYNFRSKHFLLRKKNTRRSEHKWSRPITASLGFEWRVEKKSSVASVALKTDTFCKLPAELWTSSTIALTKYYSGKYVKDTLSRSLISGITPLVPESVS